MSNSEVEAFRNRLMRALEWYEWRERQLQKRWMKFFAALEADAGRALMCQVLVEATRRKCYTKSR
jgi:hypothetical protein